jgi:hypothetical protein|nr:MAG TPA: hypothetical protein [Caudoviricetes sp.]
MNRIKDLKQYTCIKNVKAAPCDLYDAQEIIGRKFHEDDCENMMGYLIEYRTAIKAGLLKMSLRKVMS